MSDYLTHDEWAAKRSGFSYRVVTSNGAGIHGVFRTFGAAKVALSKIAHDWGLSGTVFEIERTRHLGYARQYDMRRRNRWVAWDPKRDYKDREPDHLVISQPRTHHG